MAQGVEVGQEQFHIEVLEASFEQPVLVDFFATWCGPCQILRPLLEQVAAEYGLPLAKVDIDQNPQLASAYGVEGVPDVRVVMAGEVREGFVGALPPAEIRQCLERLGITSPVQQGLGQLHQHLAAGEAAAAADLWHQLSQRFPHQSEIQVAGAELALAQGDMAAVQMRLAEAIAPESTPGDNLADQVAALQGLVALHAIAAELAAQPSRTPVEAQFLAGCQAALRADYEQALENFLAVVATDRRYRNDGGRKALLVLFQRLGPDHALTLAYRKRLMQTLY